MLESIDYSCCIIQFVANICGDVTIVSKVYVKLY